LDLRSRSIEALPRSTLGIGVGLLGAFLVLHRFLTLVYLVGVSAGFAGICIALGLLWRADQNFAGRMWTRLKNLVLSFGIMVAIVTPFFIRSWALIYEYYGIQHAVGNEKYAHAHDMGIENLSQQLLFYPKSLLQDHWGLIFFCAAAIAILSGLIASFLDRRKTPERRRPVTTRRSGCKPFSARRHLGATCVVKRRRGQEPMRWRYCRRAGSTPCRRPCGSRGTDPSRAGAFAYS
jgi:hypothetical protein